MPATCAFCVIIRGEMPAVTIVETERLIAFLDHRPLFHGHTLLAPKLTRRKALRRRSGPPCRAEWAGLNLAARPGVTVG